MFYRLNTATRFILATSQVCMALIKHICLVIFIICRWRQMKLVHSIKESWTHFLYAVLNKICIYILAYHLQTF